MEREPKFCPFIRTNHYPGLKIAELSCTELEKVLVGIKTFFRPPDLFKIFYNTSK